nr:hypothetical protein Iba_chr12bCG20380 [Ipomoea batatas]
MLGNLHAPTSTPLLPFNQGDRCSSALEVCFITGHRISSSQQRPQPTPRLCGGATWSWRLRRRLIRFRRGQFKVFWVESRTTQTADWLGLVEYEA